MAAGRAGEATLWTCPTFLSLDWMSTNSMERPSESQSAFSFSDSLRIKSFVQVETSRGPEYLPIWVRGETDALHWSSSHLGPMNHAKASSVYISVLANDAKSKDGILSPILSIVLVFGKAAAFLLW